MADGARGFNFPLPQRSMLRPGGVGFDLFAGGGHARAAGFRVPRTHELARAREQAKQRRDRNTVPATRSRAGRRRSPLPVLADGGP